MVEKMGKMGKMVISVEVMGNCAFLVGFFLLDWSMVGLGSFLDLKWLNKV